MSTGLILTDDGKIREVQAYMVSQGDGVANAYAQCVYGSNQTKEQAYEYMQEMQHQQRSELKEYGK